MYFRNEENSQQEQPQLQQYADIQCPLADSCPYQQANYNTNFRQYNPLQQALLNYILPYPPYYPPYFNPYYPPYHHPYYPPYPRPYYHEHYEPHYGHHYDYEYGHGPGRDE
jgi:hypothetical protein